MKQSLDARKDALKDLQQEGIDLILWVNGVACRVAWPMDDEGNIIHEKDIVQWLRDRNLVWTCLCPAEDGDGNMVALIDHEVDGDVILRCADEDSPCKFELNLSEVQRNTEFVDSYDVVVDGQTAEDYLESLSHNEAWACLEDDDGVEDVEATYEGWVGYYDEENRQRERGNI